MPTVLRVGPYRFHFCSDEGQEPAHDHVRTPDGECKFWLEPSIGLARNQGVGSNSLRRIERLIFENADKFREAFNEYHKR